MVLLTINIVLNTKIIESLLIWARLEIVEEFSWKFSLPTVFPVHIQNRMQWRSRSAVSAHYLLVTAHSALAQGRHAVYYNRVGKSEFYTRDHKSTHNIFGRRSLTASCSLCVCVCVQICRWFMGYIRMAACPNASCTQIWRTGKTVDRRRRSAGCSTRKICTSENNPG